MWESFSSPALSVCSRLIVWESGLGAPHAHAHLSRCRHGLGPDTLFPLPPFPTVMTVFFIGVGMSVCLHRYFSHTAFVPTSRVFTFFLAVLSTFAYQNGQSIEAVGVTEREPVHAPPESLGMNCEAEV